MGKRIWRKEWAGRYVSLVTDIAIEKTAKGWNVINPETGEVLDNLPTKREAQEVYS